MRTYQSFEDVEPTDGTAALTIGTFDGFHLGHCAVIEKLCNIGEEFGCMLVVLTFSNHPRSILDPNYHPQLLCTQTHKRYLIDHYPIDALLDLPFTAEFSQQSAEDLLRLLRTKINFSHLILGHDAHFGKDRSGTPETVKALAKKMSFEVDYVPAVPAPDGGPLSSSRIRELVRLGKLDEASSLLGRPYSIRGPVITGKGMGTVTGYRTANIDVSSLCLPPLGVYHVTMLHGNLQLEGIANLGVAPSVQGGGPIRLEVHLFDYDGVLYRKEVEVVLHQFIRPERKFDTLDALRAQIRDDVASIRKSRAQR